MYRNQIARMQKLDPRSTVDWSIGHDLSIIYTIVQNFALKCFAREYVIWILKTNMVLSPGPWLKVAIFSYICNHLCGRDFGCFLLEHILRGLGIRGRFETALK